MRERGWTERGGARSPLSLSPHIHTRALTKLTSDTFLPAPLMSSAWRWMRKPHARPTAKVAAAAADASRSMGCIFVFVFCFQGGEVKGGGGLCVWVWVWV